LDDRLAQDLPPHGVGGEGSFHQGLQEDLPHAGLFLRLALVLFSVFVVQQRGDAGLKRSFKQRLDANAPMFLRKVQSFGLGELATLTRGIHILNFADFTGARVERKRQALRPRRRLRGRGGFCWFGHLHLLLSNHSALIDLRRSTQCGSSADREGRLASAQMTNRVTPQHVMPAAQRRALRRATPATLTGVSGRPTIALAVET
jgi:hypothetical protein